MNYTVNQLRVFLKIVELQSVTKAAEELFMTQPAVSIQLKNFQEQFEIPLTQMVGRSLHITDFGYEIAEIAKRIFAEFEELKYKTKEYEGILTGSLKIASASTGKYVIPFFLTEFMDHYNGIDLMLDVTNKSQVIEALKANKIDFALVSVLPEDLAVEEEILLENKLYFVGNPDNYNKKKTLLYREEGSATRTAMEQFFEKNKTAQRKKMELTSNEAVKQAVVSGLGHSIIPLIGIKNELSNGSITFIKKRGLPIKTDWRIIWLKNKKLSPVAKAYLSYIREHKESILDKHFKWYMDFNAL